MVEHCAIEANSGFGFGVFVPPRRKSDPPRIAVAAGLADLCEAAGESRADALLAVLHTFLHEFAHYEQWRDGRTLQERGVNVRARSLLRSIEKGGRDGQFRPANLNPPRNCDRLRLPPWAGAVQ